MKQAPDPSVSKAPFKMEVEAFGRPWSVVSLEFRVMLLGSELSELSKLRTPLTRWRLLSSGQECAGGLPKIRKTYTHDFKAQLGGCKLAVVFFHRLSYVVSICTPNMPKHETTSTPTHTPVLSGFDLAPPVFDAAGEVPVFCPGSPNMPCVPCSRPDVFAAAGEWCKETNRSERFWDDLGWKGSTLKAGKEGRAGFRAAGEIARFDVLSQLMLVGIWAFFRALKKWRKMEPTIMLPVAKNLKSHCCHPEPEIANNAQRIMAVCAGCLFSIRGQGPAVKSIRHLFARDMIYWLQHADDDDRADICGELSRCGPHLLGRFNKACAAELVEACKPGNGDVCRSNARKALTVFVENDAALHPFVWPLIEELRWALPPDEKREIHRMRARILLTGACQSASDAWHAGLAAKKMVSKALQDCFQACPSCT